MSDIVERLRRYIMPSGNIKLEAADEITRLRADLAAVTEERNWWRNKQDETANILGLAVDAIRNRPTPVDGIKCLTPEEKEFDTRLRAERDAMKAEFAKAQEIARMQAERIGGYINEQEKRDAVIKTRKSLAEAAAKERAELAAVTEERDRMRALLVCLYDAAGPLDADKMPADDFAQIITIVLDARAALEGVTEKKNG